MINYRYQALMEDPGRPAFSPRLSLILPTGAREHTSDSVGFQVNLPVSKQFGDLYVHGNTGLTWYPRANPRPGRGGSERVALTSPHVAGSGIYRIRPMLNVMLESVLTFEHSVNRAGRKRRDTVFTLSPGARGGWNIGDQQVIAGAAVPITWVSSDSSAGIFLYLSYELPFSLGR
jgi:hypothetical protein